ncbi:hypothetical protein RclHR1_04840007 [Rhizophagus clarus]|uniref:Uncharacterized protein n=1 Tax=Rhizophagus clarus TaxID=94130 RepID=A0A2Z6RKI7_9GLOM|nr:hypothetical protein RclHR1_04840007 [Rhizophagus clarus]
MELISAKSKHSFDPTPRLKSSPVPILFIPFNNNKYYDSSFFNYSIPSIHVYDDSKREYKCNYCKSEFSRTSTNQQYCKNCFFDYVSKLTDDNMYLDVHIRTEETQCIEHEPRNKDFTQNIQEWCRNCSEISHFNQIVTEYLHHSHHIFKGYKCNLCGYDTKSNLCPNCYLISSEFIESTLNGEPIPIVYLPWWDDSSYCLRCMEHLNFKSDCQKWCSRCFIIFSGCRYCLTTNFIIGITEQSNCRKCKRVIDIDITDIDNKENILVPTRINISGHLYIVNYMNNIDQKSNNLMDSVYKILRQVRQLKHHTYPIKTNGQIRFLPFDNNEDDCSYCRNRYFSTLLFGQKYCKCCLYWYIKEQTDKYTCSDVYICSGDIQCVYHETRNLDFRTQNIQEWCINCSEILYFKQVITKFSFDKNYYYYEKQNEIIKYGKGCKICKICGYQQDLLNNTEFSLCSNCYSTSSGRIKSILTEKDIPILYLSWWYDHKRCIVCKHILKDLSVPLPKKTLSEASQKWCSNCFTIYVGCKYCITTNIIFGLTNQSQCKKCERISFITIDTEDIEENYLVSIKLNADNHNLIIDFTNNINKNFNPLRIYDFISKLSYFDLKYILYSNLKNDVDFSIPIIFIPFNYESTSCYYCREEYSTTLLFNQKYCKSCLYWYIKFTKPETRNIDVRITTSNTQCTDHISRNLDFYTENIQKCCINCSEILYFGQLITDHLIDMDYYKIQD